MKILPTRTPSIQRYHSCKVKRKTLVPVKNLHTEEKCIIFDALVKILTRPNEDKSRPNK